MDGKPASSEAASSALTPIDALADLERLGKLLVSGDSEAGRLVEEITGRLDGSDLAAAIKPVADAIGDFDFDLALERLEALRKA